MSGWSTEVDAPPAVVRARLRASLLPMRSLWFPTLAEMRRWDRSDHPLWIRWHGPDGFEVGPRLFNLQAARFCPVLRGRLREVGGRTRVEGEVATPRFTAGLLGVWSLVLAAWLGLGLRGVLVADADPGFLVWWAVLLAGLVAVAVLGRTQGGAALEAALPALARCAADPEAGDDDWDAPAEG